MPTKRKPLVVKNAAKAIARQGNIKRTLDGLLAGKSTREMAEELGVSGVTIHLYVQEAHAQMTPLDVDSWREVQLERCQSIIAANHAKRHLPQNAKVILAADKMIGDLVGTFAPKAIDVSGTIVTAAMGDEIMAKLERLADSDESEDPRIEVTILPQPDEPEPE